MGFSTPGGFCSAQGTGHGFCPSQGATTAFSPLSLSPALWLKADGVLWQDSARTTLATADGDPVGAWDDASGNGNHVLQATAAKRPARKNAIINGRTVVRGDGVDDFLSVALTQAQAFTLFLVLQRASTSALPKIIAAGDSASECAIFYGNSLEFRTYAGTEQSILSPDDTALHLAVVVINGASSSARMDGVARTLAGSPGANTLTKFSLFGYGDGTTNADVDIAEAVLVSGVVSGADIALMETYLNTRWGVY